MPMNTRPSNAVLMVDDDPDDCVFAMGAFKRGKLKRELQCLNGGAELLRSLRGGETRPALVLLDLNMPGMNGFEVLELIKADSEFKDIPVVVLSTSSADTDIEKSYRLGANSFVTKPAGMREYDAMMASLDHYWFGTVTLPHEHA